MKPVGGCTGCGYQIIEAVVETKSGNEYGLCIMCLDEFKDTGKIPTDSLVNDIKKLILECEEKIANNL